jgi:hypothetical protein
VKPPIDIASSPWFKVLPRREGEVIWKLMLNFCSSDLLCFCVIVGDRVLASGTLFALFADRRLCALRYGQAWQAN